MKTSAYNTGGRKEDMSEREKELERRIAKLEAENAQLKHDGRLLAGRTALAWVGMVSASWRHSLEKHAITIREQVELIRYDLHTNFEITTINRRLDMIERLANRLLKKPIVPSLSSEEAETIDVTNLIRERINQLRRHIPYSEVEMKLITPKEVATVRISPEWFTKGLDILIDNAVEAMKNAQTKQLVIKVTVHDEQIAIDVEDIGYEIPANIIPLLFIQPIPRKENEKGLGLGLLMAQMIFHSYGGDLKLTQTSPHGTVFTIILPQTS